MAFHKKILSLFLVLISVVVYAQPRSFSRKPEVYIQEFNKYIATGNTKEGEVFVALFTEKWNAGYFAEDEQRTIMRVSNEMLMNDLRIPDFVLFTETILLGKDSVDVEKYDSWRKALIPAVRSGNKTFITLLTASRNLFKENILYA
ncbi:MAG: hypothetical protein KJP21_02085, partial [Bacteroidia bacterium]|nr:hypothetical protein [Bacteroidia bacterium]